RSGLLWIGTIGGGLNRLDPATGRFTAFRNDSTNPSSISDNAVWSIHEDPEGILWLGTRGGLHRFDPQTGKATAYHVRDGLPNETVYGILGDAHGKLWLSTHP